MTLPSGIYQLMAPRAHKTRSTNISNKDFDNLVEALHKFLDLVLDNSVYKTCIRGIIAEFMKPPSRDVSEKINTEARLNRLLRELVQVSAVALNSDVPVPSSLDLHRITLDDLTDLFTKEELLKKAGWIIFISTDSDNIMYVGEKTLMHDTFVQTSRGSVELKHGERTLGQMETDDVIQESTEVAKSTTIGSVSDSQSKCRGNVSDDSSPTIGRVSENASIIGSVSDPQSERRENVSDNSSIKIGSVSDGQRNIGSMSLATAKIGSVSENSHVALDSNSDTKVRSCKQVHFAKTVSRIATYGKENDKSFSRRVLSHHERTYGEYFDYRYDPKPSPKTFKPVNDVEKLSLAVRAVTINSDCVTVNTSPDKHRQYHVTQNGHGDYFKYRYDDQRNSSYNGSPYDHRHVDEVNKENKISCSHDDYESMNRYDHSHVDEINKEDKISYFQDDYNSSNRYDYTTENDTHYVVDHYNQEIYEDDGIDYNYYSEDEYDANSYDDEYDYDDHSDDDHEYDYEDG